MACDDDDDDDDDDPLFEKNPFFVYHRSKF